MTLLSSARRLFSGCLSLALLLASVPQAAYAAIDKSVEIPGIHGIHLPVGPAKPFAPRPAVNTGKGVDIKTKAGVEALSVLPSATAGADAAAQALPTIRLDESGVFTEGLGDLTGEDALGRASKNFKGVSGVADGDGIAGAIDNAGGAFKGHVAPDGFGGAEPVQPQGASSSSSSSDKSEPAGKPAAALEPAAPQAPAAAPAVAEAPAAPAAKPSVVTTVREAWKQGLILLSAQLIAQIGVEAWAAVWNKWVQINYGMDVFTMTTMAGMATGLVAGYAGGWVSDKIGDKRAAVFAWYGVAIVAAGTLWLAGEGMLGTPLLIGMLIGRLFVTGAGTTAEKTLPITVFKDHKGELGKYNSIAQTTLEIAGIFVPAGISILIGFFGMLGTMWIMPIAMGIGATFMLLLLKVAKTERGLRLLAGDPAAPRETNPALLSLGRWLYPLLSMRNLLLYSVIAIGFGNALFPGVDKESVQLANGFAGQIVGLYSAGGLIAGLWLSGLVEKGWEWVRSKFPKLPSMPVPDETEAGEIRAASKWLVISAIAGAIAFVPMVLGVSPYIVLAGLVLVGLTDVVSTLQVLGIIQKNTPLERKGKVMGMVRTTVTLTGLIGFFGFSQLFKYFAAGATAAVTLPLIGLTIPAAVVPLVPFYAFIAVNVLLAAYFIFMSRKLKAKIPVAPREPKA
jgi:hypothetical protein